MKGECQLIRQFLGSSKEGRGVEWATPDNIAYLLYGRYDAKLKNRADWIMTQMLDVKDQTRRIKKLKCQRVHVYACWDYPSDSKGTSEIDHDIEARNCAAKHLYETNYELIDTLSVKPYKLREDWVINSDWRIMMRFGGQIVQSYWEHDRNSEKEEKIVSKLNGPYSEKGRYLVIFTVSDYLGRTHLEPGRLEKLFKISGEVLKKKKGRVLGACYTEFLRSGKIQNHNGEKEL